MVKKPFIPLFLLALAAGSAFGQSTLWQTAARNGAQANEALGRCLNVVDAWYTHTGKGNLLLPRTLTQRVWRPNDTTADMWSHFVNAAYLAGDAEMQANVLGTMIDEIRYTTRVGRLSDNYNIDSGTFEYATPNLYSIIFGGAEEVKDGLLPIIDLTGGKFYVERARAILTDIMARAPISTSKGKIPDSGAEVCGDMLQGLCRLYGATADPNMKLWAERIGDAWIFEVLAKNNGIPCHKWDFTSHKSARDMLQLNDHGNEIVVGLVELLMLEYVHDRSHYNQYKGPMGKMIDRLLEHAIDAKGVWAFQIRPSDLKILKTGQLDTWGYCTNAVYAMYLMTGQSKYRQAVERIMRAVATDPKNLDYGWSNDSFADSIESGILLYNRIALPEVSTWLEQLVPKFLAWQKAGGLVQDTYLDGNYVRSALMWAMMKTAGTRVLNWRADLQYGAVVSGNKLNVRLGAGKAWQGLLCFDGPRASQNLGLQVDYPRINQFPQWYVIQPDRLYYLTINGIYKPVMLGQELIDGLPLNVGTAPVQVVVWPKSGPPYAK